MLLLYIQQFTQPLSRLKSPIALNQSRVEFEKPAEEFFARQPLDLSEEMRQIKQVYHLERRLFL